MRTNTTNPDLARTVDAVDATADHNARVERAELAEWANRPVVQVGYYSFPAEASPLFGRPRVWRREFAPILHTYVDAPKIGDPGTDHHAVVTTWPGTIIGTITRARVHTNNLGARVVSIRVTGTNGAKYHGRASWDGGTVITLRRCA